MSNSEFYSKALTDSAFRAEQIETQRYQKKLAIILGVGGIACSLAYIAYCRIYEARWPNDTGGMFLFTTCAVLYSHSQAKLSALKALAAAAQPRL